MFAVRLLAHHNAVSDSVCVWDPFLVFPLVVLDDELLLACPDIFPIGLEGDVEQRVAPKNELGWRCARGGMDGSIDGSSHGGQNSFEVEVRVKISLVS